MTKFIEVLIDGSYHSINIDNIALIKQVGEFTEIYLLTPDKLNNQLKFKIAYNYGHFRALLQKENRYGFPSAFTETK